MGTLFKIGITAIILAWPTFFAMCAAEGTRFWRVAALACVGLMAVSVTSVGLGITLWVWSQ